MIDQPVLLYGPPGAGKSTVGRLLAAAWDVPFYDLDAEIVRSVGKEIPRIFSEEGEAAFRNYESAALNAVLDGRPAVLALGGGALLRPENRALAEGRGVVLVLQAAAETLRRRLQGQAERPLLQGGAARLDRLLAERQAHYQSFSLQVATDGLAPEAVLWEVQTALGAFRLQAMGEPYWVRVVSGSELAETLPVPQQAALLSDRQVAARHASRARHLLAQRGVTVRLFRFQNGENSKTLRTAGRLWRKFAQIGLERSNWVIGLGGGVTTDLAGFVASAYLRGVPWAAMPTSLLGMVDASLGGKTGVNLPEGKNLVGAFWPPRWVWADTAWLATLPPAEVRNGMAEVVKHGVIADPLLFTRCAAGLQAVAADWLTVIRRAVAVKAKVIESDPYEHGLRQVLNFGHTLGHALEAASAYRLRHGEAVAIGMVLEARLSVELGLAAPDLPEQIAVVLGGLGLPVQIPAWLDRQAALGYVHRDKKRRAGRVRFALPRAVGAVETGFDVPDEAWQRALLEG